MKKFFNNLFKSKQTDITSSEECNLQDEYFANIAFGLLKNGHVDINTTFVNEIEIAKIYGEFLHNLTTGHFNAYIVNRFGEFAQAKKELATFVFHCLHRWKQLIDQDETKSVTKKDEPVISPVLALNPKRMFK